MTQPTVRRAVAEDASVIASIHIEAWRTAYRGLVPDGILDGFDLGTRTTTWRTRLERQPASDAARVWLVETEDVVRGFAATEPGRDESAPAPPGSGEVTAIYLRPAVIGQGLGRSLFTHAVDDLRARRFDPIVVWVFESNPRARAFYDAAGLWPDGARHVIDFDGEPIAEVRYVLRLGFADPDERTGRSGLPDRAGR